MVHALCSAGHFIPKMFDLCGVWALCSRTQSFFLKKRRAIGIFPSQYWCHIFPSMICEEEKNFPQTKSNVGVLIKLSLKLCVGCHRTIRFILSIYSTHSDSLFLSIQLPKFQWFIRFHFVRRSNEKLLLSDRTHADIQKLHTLYVRVHAQISNGYRKRSGYSPWKCEIGKVLNREKGREREGCKAKWCHNYGSIHRFHHLTHYVVSWY